MFDGSEPLTAQDLELAARCAGRPAIALVNKEDRPTLLQLFAATRARDALASALDAAAGGFGLDAVSVCVDYALDALCELTGENASERVIDQVFERFCVGK